MHDMYDEILDEVEELHWMPHAARAQLFEDRAHALDPGAPGRAAWLSHAGEAWELDGSLRRARACYEQAVADGGGAFLDPRAELLGVVLELGDTAAAEPLLTTLREAVRDGTAGNFVHETVGEALERHGRLEEALRWFSAGLTASERATPDDPDIGCLNGRFRVRRALGMPYDRYDTVSEERRRQYADQVGDEQRLLDAPGGTEQVTFTVLYWPPEEFAQLLERWPDLAEDLGADHAEHRALVERHLRRLAEHRSGLAVSTGRFDDYLRYSDCRGSHARDGSTRASYAAHLGHLGRTTPWPPSRNDRCWCGSALKYKKCCGAPGLDAGG